VNCVKIWYMEKHKVTQTEQSISEMDLKVLKK
jgi:hypothetical protein